MDPVTVNIHHAKTHLSKLLARVAEGEEIVIAKAGKPIAKLVPVKPVVVDRTPGWGKDWIIWVADDFDEMPEDLQREFEKGFEEDFNDGPKGKPE